MTPYRKMQLGLLMVFAILATAGLNSCAALEEASNRQQWVRHTNEIRVQLAKFSAAIERAQAASLAYRLSGQEARLDDAIGDLNLAAQYRMRLVEMTKDNPEQQARLAALASLARPLTLAVAKATHDGAMAVSLAAYLRAAADIERAELGLLARRESALEAQFSRAKLLVVLGTLLGLVLVVVAVTLSRKDDAAARRITLANEERMRALVDGVQEYALYMLDHDGTVTSWNAGAQCIKGYAADEIIGQNFSRFYSTQDAAAGKPQKELEEAAANGRSEFESWRVRRDGTRFLAHVVLTATRDSNGVLVGFSKIVRDVSEREESEARYRGLLEAAPDAMVVVNAVGDIVLVSPQTEKQFGYRRDELIGRKITEIFPEGFAERLISDGLHTSAVGTLSGLGSGIELHARRRDGSDFPVEIMLSPLKNPEGTLISAAIRDISARKISEGKLQSAVDEFGRSNTELELPDR